MYLALSRRNRSREAAVPNQPVTRGYVVGPGEGMPGRGPDVKASGQSTGGSLTVIEAAIDGGPPRHTHTREDESFYVLTGTLDVECGEDRFRAGVVCVPAA
jgi:mannose-6-phosphate isomerase-like protein (cupin superfamily)